MATLLRVREYGTAGINRLWCQFEPDDKPLELPLYDGRIDPGRWSFKSAAMDYEK